MATNLVFRNIDSKNRSFDAGETYAPGVPLLDPAGEPVVTVTGSGDYTISESLPPYTISGIPHGGFGLEGTEVTVADDGTWEFEVDGADPLTIDNGEPIYIDTNGELTVTEASNTLYGHTDFPLDYDRTRGVVPVRIGR